MQRLAFIRLLHQQGLEQSRLPDPLAASCILTFHDAVELYLILVSEHLGITVQDRGTNFVSRYFDGLHPDKVGPQGVDLAVRIGIKRLTTARNSFKHDAAHPAGKTIEQGRNDASQFFEDNTPRVFGIGFHEIDSTGLIPQQHTREHLKAADRSEAEGDRLTAMAKLADAVGQMLLDQVHDDEFAGRPTAYSFGNRMPRHTLRTDQVRRTLEQPDHAQRRGVPVRAAESLAQEIVTTRDVTRALQDGMRLIALGVDFHLYQRFVALTPVLAYNFGSAEPTVHAEDGYAPNQEEFEFCRQFVVTLALRLAEINAHVVAPSWRRKATEPPT